MTVCEYRAGLEGIPATQSSISFVDGQRGLLEYRGISVEELAEKSTFLETSYLLIWGELPKKEELELFEYEICHHRRLKYRIRDMMKCFPEGGHPMDALQACAAALGLFYSRRAGRSGLHSGRCCPTVGQNPHNGSGLSTDAERKRPHPAP